MKRRWVGAAMSLVLLMTSISFPVRAEKPKATNVPEKRVTVTQPEEVTFNEWDVYWDKEEKNG